MNEEIKNNSIIKCCICDNRNHGEFTIIENKKYHLNCITNLQEENQKLKENQSGFTLEDYTRILNNYQELKETNEEHRKINGQLREDLIVMNNKNMELVKVIDGIEEMLNHNIKEYGDSEDYGLRQQILEDKIILLRLNELKGGKDESLH